MPIPNEEDAVEIFEQPIDNYKTATIVDIETPIIKLKQYIEGSNWTVDYFNQAKGEDDNIDQLDPNTPATLQQYIEIKDFILKVISPLDISKPDELEGSATIAYNIKPQVNDIFRVHISHGRLALFRLTEVDYKHYNLNGVFDVTYKLLALEDVNPLYFEALNERIVKTYYFNKDSIMDESDPILLPSEKIYQTLLKNTISEISEYYIYKFRDRVESFLTYEAGGYKLVDPLINALYFNIVDGNTRDLVLVNKVGEFDIKRDISNTVLEALLVRNIKLLKNVNRFVGIISTASLSDNPLFRTVYYSTINFIALNPDNVLNDTSSDLFIGTFPRDRSREDDLLPSFVEGDASYLFTEDFFTDNRANLSTLELLVLDYLEKKTLDADKMILLIESFREWNDIEQYYFLPILLLLISVDKREIFSTTY